MDAHLCIPENVGVNTQPFADWSRIFILIA